MKKRAVIAVAVIAALIAGILVYGMLDPATVPFPRCAFYVLTGLKCPGCGTQRAIHQLLHFNIGKAFEYNAFMVMCIPLLLFLAAAELLRDKYPALHKAAYNSTLSWCIAAAVMLWWILRNIFCW